MKHSTAHNKQQTTTQSTTINHIILLHLTAQSNQHQTQQSATTFNRHHQEMGSWNAGRKRVRIYQRKELKRNGKGVRAAWVGWRCMLVRSWNERYCGERVTQMSEFTKFQKFRFSNKYILNKYLMNTMDIKVRRYALWGIKLMESVHQNVVMNKYCSNMVRTTVYYTN